VGKKAVSPAVAGIVIALVVVVAIVFGMKMLGGNKSAVSEDMRKKYGANGQGMDLSKVAQPGQRPPGR
jgi:hypothetical protein